MQSARVNSMEPPARAAWIETVDETEASGRLAEPYASCLDPESGRVDHVLLVHGLHPAGLAAHLALYRSAMSGSAGLRKVEREMIAVVVSKENGCHY